MSEEISDREFHDPDYIEAVPLSKKSPKISDEETAEKIRQIVKREFDAEIARRENDLDVLDDRLIEAKKTLSGLRYAIVKHHYTNEKLFPTDDEVQAEITSQADPVARLKVQSMLKNQQKQIHPAIKKIIGSGSEIDFDEILKVRAPRKRGKLEPALPENLTIPVDPNIDSLRPDTIQEPIAGPSHSITGQSNNPKTSSSSAVGGDVEDGIDDKTLKVPRYIEPKGMNTRVLEINPNIRNKHKTKFRIIIGNTSKYTAPQSKADRSTHKWLLYIRGPRDTPDISHFVSSVSVQLHDSYAPHNIFHLRSPPYHISRRGWGEFPVKLRIHFKNEKLNKPVNLEHLLKLDRNYSGLQELGGETVVDVWLYTDESMIENKTNKSETKQITTVPKPIPNRDRHNLLNSEFFPLYNLNNTNRTINHDNCDENNQEDSKDDQDSLLLNNNIKKEETADDVLEINETKMECDIDYRVALNNIKKEKEDNLQGDCHSDFNGCSIKIKDEPMDESMDSLYYNDNSNTNMTQHNIFNNEIGDLFEVSNTEVLPVQNNYVVPKIESFTNNTEKSVKRLVKKQQVSLLKCNNSNSLLNPLLNEKFKNKEKPISSSRSLLKCNSNLSKEKSSNNLSLLNSMLNDHCYVNEKYLMHNILETKDHQPERKIINDDIVKSENFIHSIVDPLKDFNVLYTNKAILLDGATLLNNFPKSSHKIVLGRNNDSSYRIGLSKADCLMRQRVIEVVSFFRENLQRCADTRSAVSLMLKKMPMIDDSAHSGEYLKAFPYAVQSADIYFSLSIPKRRNLEWTRAKILQNYLKIFFMKKARAETDIWTTKQIILFSHCYGYFPIKNTFTDTENAQFDDSNNFYLYGYSGEKTFQEKIDLKEQFASASHINTKTKIDVFTSNEIKREKLPVIKIKKEFPDDIDNLECNTDLKVSYSAPEITREPNHEINIRDRNIVYELDDSSDEEIDICNLSDVKSQGGHLAPHEITRKMANYEMLPFENDDEKLQCFYIERKCAELGIELRNEHVGNGFSHSLVHKTILAAVKCLVEDIVRRSLAVKMAAMDSKTDITIANIGQTVTNPPKLWDNKGRRMTALEQLEINRYQLSQRILNEQTNICPSPLLTPLIDVSLFRTENGSVHTVSLRHVYEGILGRKELDLLTNMGLGSEEIKYHGTL